MDADVQVNIRIPVSMLRRMRLAAAAADLTVSQWMRAAIREKLGREETSNASDELF